MTPTPFETLMNSSSVKEIQVNQDGSLEVSYEPLCAETYDLLAKYDRYEVYARNGGTLEMVSESEGALVLIYATEQSADHEDYEGYKLYGDREIYKRYTKHFWTLPNMQLPKTARLANQFGIGYYPTVPDKFDVYFFCDTQRDAEDHFGVVINCADLEPYRDRHGLYGVTYTTDHKVLNLKRYLYPVDPYCERPEEI